MGIVRARHALLLIGSIGLIGLAGCKSTGNSWAFWNSSPAKDPAAVAKSDYPVPPSKSAAPTVVGPSGNRTGAGTPGAATSLTGGPTSGTANPGSGNYGAAPAGYYSPAGTTAARSAAISSGARLGSTPGMASISDPGSVGPQRGPYDPAAGPASTSRTALPGSSPSLGAAGYPSTPSSTYPSTAAGSSLYGSAPPGGYRSAARDSSLPGTGTGSGGLNSPGGIPSSGSRYSVPSERYGAGSDRTSLPADSYGTSPGRYGGGADSYGTGPAAYGSTLDRSGSPADRYGAGGSSSPSAGSSRWDSGSPASATSPLAGSRPSADPFLPSRSKSSAVAGEDRYGSSPFSSGSSGYGSRAAGGLDPNATPENTPSAAGYDTRGGDTAPDRSRLGAPSSSYSPGNTGYSPGNTGYNPPAGSYSPGSAGYNPPAAAPYRSTTTPYGSPTANTDEGASYRPGSIDPRRKAEFAGFPAGKSSTEAGATSRSDPDVAPVSYDAQSSGAVRR